MINIKRKKQKKKIKQKLNLKQINFKIKLMWIVLEKIIKNLKNNKLILKITAKI